MIGAYMLAVLETMLRPALTRLPETAIASKLDVGMIDCKVLPERARFPKFTRRTGLAQYKLEKTIESRQTGLILGFLTIEIQLYQRLHSPPL